MTGTDPAMWAATPGGAIVLAVWREFEDASEIEFELAGTPAPGRDWPPTPDDAVARIRAIRQAEQEARRVARFSRSAWLARVRHVWPLLTEGQRSEAQEILQQVSYLEPGVHVVPREAHGFTADQIRDAVEAVRKERTGYPSLARVAEKLHTTEPTLKRAVKELELGKWPPAAR